MDEGVDRRLTARLEELHWAVSSSRKGGCHILAHHHTRKLHVCSFTPRRRYLQPHHSCLPWSREKERRMTKRELKLYKKLFSLQRHTKMDFVSALVAMPVDYGNMFSKRCRQKTPPISQAHQKTEAHATSLIESEPEGPRYAFPQLRAEVARNDAFGDIPSCEGVIYCCMQLKWALNSSTVAQCLSVCLSLTRLSSAPRT